MAKYLLSGTILVSVWFFLDFLSFSLQNPEMIYWVEFCRYPEIIFIPPLFYLFAVEYSNFKFKDSRLHLLIYVIPVLSLISWLTNLFPYTFLTDVKLEFLNDLPAFSFSPELGFYIHTYYSYSIIAVALFIFAVKAVKSPKIYRRQSIFIFLGSLVSFVTNVMAIYLKTFFDFADLTSVFMFLTMLIVYLGVFRIPKLTVVPIARELLIENLSDITVITDLDGNVIDLNPAALTFIQKNQLGGCTKATSNETVIGKKLDELFDFITQKVRIEKLLRDDENITVTDYDRQYDFRLYQAAITDKEKLTIGYLYMLQDITEKKKNEIKLHQLAYYDSLTGLGNRNLFYKRLEETMQNIVKLGTKCACLMIDIDDFKIINDSLGHTAGDIIIKETAQRMGGFLKDSATIFRFPGDEFAILITDFTDPEECDSKIQSLLSLFERPFSVSEKSMTLSISIGVAMVPEDDQTVHGIVRKADAALHEAKRNGKARCFYSNDEIEKRNQEILEMQHQMKYALENNEFQLYLQPQVAYSRDETKVVGAEALIRWIRDGKFLFRPDQFIEAAEKNGMILPIGRWISEEIFRINKRLYMENIRIKLSFNVSSKQLEDKNFIEHLKQISNEYSDTPINLVAEITESFLLNNMDQAIKQLNSLKKMGIGIALDDFGTGYSSLSYLKNLPFDYLKIDKAFIDDLTEVETNLTPNIIMMAKTLNLETVAEGVETIEQVESLVDYACEYLQGYYFSRPLDVESFINYCLQQKYKV